MCSVCCVHVSVYAYAAQTLHHYVCVQLTKGADTTSGVAIVVSATSAPSLHLLEQLAAAQRLCQLLQRELVMSVAKKASAATDLSRSTSIEREHGSSHVQFEHISRAQMLATELAISLALERGSELSASDAQEHTVPAINQDALKTDKSLEEQVLLQPIVAHT